MGRIYAKLSAHCGSTSSYESHYYVPTTVLYDNTSIGAEYNDQSYKALCCNTWQLCMDGIYTPENKPTFENTPTLFF